VGGVTEVIKRYEDSVVVLMIEKKGDFNLSTDTAILAAFYREQAGALREVVQESRSRRQTAVAV